MNKTQRVIISGPQILIGQEWRKQYAIVIEGKVKKKIDFC